MVKVREDFPLRTDGEVDIAAWLARLPLGDMPVSRLVAACETARQISQHVSPGFPSGEPWLSFYTGLEMVEILADLKLDEDALIAAALYRSVREQRIDLSEIQQRFGKAAKLIDGVARMAVISQVANERVDEAVLGTNEAQSETIRKMLVAIVDDARVALIKLAERTCAIRAVKNKPHKRYRVAREVFTIYAPLAHRLGIGHIKWELEDLSFRYLQPNTYKKIARLLDEKRLDRQAYIDALIAELYANLKLEGIEAEIIGRAKHIYSIWKKMERKGVGFSQVYDIRAVRILVKDVKDCYAVLGIVHGLWRSVANEFDDYIANPKENGYRSLHTAVIGPGNKALEVQIRSEEMHHEAEFGVCAHWEYKGTEKGSKAEQSYEDKLNWLRQVLDWQEPRDIDALQQTFNNIRSRVYVFTPDGHVVDLDEGATPVDFAYHVHTAIGHRCRGARVNERMVPLTYTLQTGDRVEIITAEEEEPRRDWLQADLGFVTTARARGRVQAWFRQQAREEKISAGRHYIEKAFRDLNLSSTDYRRVANELVCDSVDDMFVRAGTGEITLAEVVAVAHRLMGQEPPTPCSPKNSSEDQRLLNEISGAGNAERHIAGCCKPVQGDEIIGYRTLARGVSVHRQDCKKLHHYQCVEPERIVELRWLEEAQRQREPLAVDLQVEAYDRAGLLRDITLMMAEANYNLLAVNTDTDTRAGVALMNLRVQLDDFSELGALLGKLKQVPNIIAVRRQSQ